MKNVIYSLIILCIVTIGCSDLFDRSKNKLPIDIELINIPGDILFTVPENGIRVLYSMDINGENVKKILQSDVSVTNAQWNQAGNEIIFSVPNSEDSRVSNFYFINRNLNITYFNNFVIDMNLNNSPRWNKNDTEIVFTVEVVPSGLDYDVFSFNFASKEIRNLTNTSGIREADHAIRNDILYTAQNKSVIRYDFDNNDIEFIRNDDKYYYGIINGEDDIYYTYYDRDTLICNSVLKINSVTNLSGSIKFDTGETRGYRIINNKGGLFLIERIYFRDEDICVLTPSNYRRGIILYNLSTRSYKDITPIQFSDIGIQDMSGLKVHSWRKR